MRLGGAIRATGIGAAYAGVRNFYWTSRRRWRKLEATDDLLVIGVALVWLAAVAIIAAACAAAGRADWGRDGHVQAAEDQSALVSGIEF
jgi:hypothetical protein